MSALKFWLSSLTTLIKPAFNVGLFTRPSHRFPESTHISNDFFGVNVATQKNPACDDKIIALCKQLNINHVRLDFCYQHLNSFGERFLKRLLAENFDVLLHLVPPREAMQKLGDDPQVEKDWSDFLGKIFTQYGHKVNAIEIGSTPNRKKWSGLTYAKYIQLWQVVCQHDTRNIKLAGPNVSDFEPIANITLLHWLRKLGRTPDIHTENLFVERVKEPENFDHRVAGKWATKLLKLNLVKKAQLYQHISQQFGIKKTFCTNTFWQDNRLKRWSHQPAQKKADYLVRYLVIAAASGALNRVYWGPLVGFLDGLIDDNTQQYPNIERVCVYDQTYGNFDDYQPSSAFNALANVVKLLSNTQLIKAQSTLKGLSQFVFKTENNTEIHIVWTQDGLSLPLNTVYDQPALINATSLDASGQTLTTLPKTITESPFFIIKQKRAR